MKKFLISLSSFLLLSMTAFAATFPDVEEGYDHYDAIEFLAEREIVDGYDDGLFRPDKLVSRAEATKMIVGGLGVEIGGEYEVVFPDVNAEAWFFPYVMGGYEAGIIDGYQDGTFKPGDTVNMAETLKILLESAGVQMTTPTKQVFADVGPDEWFSKHALYAREYNIVIADDEGRLNADKDMSRAEFAEVVYRLMVVMETGEPFPIEQNWPYYESDSMPFSMKYDDETWKMVQHYDEVVFYAPDKDFDPELYQRVTPNLAKVTVTYIETDLSELQYFAMVKAAFPDSLATNFSREGEPGLEILQAQERMVDWYFYLGEGKVLAVFTEYGDGELGFKHPQYIKAMLKTLTFSEPTEVPVEQVPTTTDEEILSDILGNILIEGVGLAKIENTGDAIIIETDTIGVGTGPVDYYYSAKFNYTFKYERASDVILDAREGNTTAF